MVSQELFPVSAVEISSFHTTPHFSGSVDFLLWPVIEIVVINWSNLFQYQLSSQG